MNRRRICTATMAPVAVAVATLPAPTAAADSSGLTMVPLMNMMRQCDFVLDQFLLGRGTGTASGAAHIGLSGAGTVRADVRIQTADPNTTYQVRLIQTPRSAAETCKPGAPGVATGVMHSDVAGNASTTVTGPRQSGSTGAWVVVEGPTQPGTVEHEVYSTTFLVEL